MDEKLAIYDPPIATIIVFDMKENIASSGDYGSDLVCSESIFD